MHIKNRTASIAFKFLVALLGTFGLAISSGLASGSYDMQFHCMFTNLSNVAVCIYFWCSAIHHVRSGNGATPWHPKLKYALTLCITVTFLVAHFMLNWGMVFMGSTFHIEMLMLHYLAPIGAILDWLLFDEKGHMQLTDPPKWLIPLYVYFGYILILVLGCGVSVTESCRWPYPFIDFDTLGVAGGIVNIVVLTIAVTLLGYLYVAADRALAKRAK